MPTRIVLNETVATRQQSPRQRTVTQHSNTNTSYSLVNQKSSSGSDIEAARGSTNSNSLAFHGSSPPAKLTKSARKVVQLRSSVFSRGAKKDEFVRALSREDIRASPRLLGYLFQLLASAVMLISVLKFYFNGEEDTKSLFMGLLMNNGEAQRFFNTVYGVIFRWKLIGCVATSTLGTFINLVVVLVHFDTFFFPSFWLAFFRDGSRYEMYFVIAMLVFWIAGIHINTSPLAVGEVQANVYFTTWIAFISSVINVGTWRVSAGKKSIALFINNHERETTYNWLWTMFFAATCAGATCSAYANRDYVSLTFQNQPLVVSQRDWIIIMSVLWSFVVICMLSIALNHYLKKSCEIRVCRGGVVLFGWRQTEGLIALGLAGAYFWFVFEYTGVDGFINGVNNLYYGAWGSFINSVFLLATWLRENKNIEFIRKEEIEREEMMEQMARRNQP